MNQCSQMVFPIVYFKLNIDAFVLYYDSSFIVSSCKFKKYVHQRFGKTFLTLRKDNFLYKHRSGNDLFPC